MSFRHFGSVHVISLPQSHDRRSRLTGHLSKAGLADFALHDAFGPDHPEVRALYRQGLVSTFPPCFRCGKLSCGNDDCNNVLVPAQVANFASHLALWKQIARSDHPALVMEDDVVLHDWAPATLGWLADRIDEGTLDFAPDRPRLLRLGWALSPDHDPSTAPRLATDIRMSNPCYALTPAFARALLQRWERVATTSDIFLHRLAPREGEAVTLFPPIASDLSWSLGTVPSTIHPKALHADHLRSQGDVAGAERHEALIKAHVKHMFWRDILVLGHPRGGTGYLSHALRQWGLEIGHESNGKDGLSSWMFAVEGDAPWALHSVARNRAALAFRTLIQVVRDPTSAAPSIMREDEYAPASFAYRRQHLLDRFGLDLQDYPPLDRAILSLCLWSRLIFAQSPAQVQRLEDDMAPLRSLLKEQGYAVDEAAPTRFPPVNSDKLYKGRRYQKPDLTPRDWTEMHPRARQELTWYCQTFGYPLSA